MLHSLCSDEAIRKQMDEQWKLYYNNREIKIEMVDCSDEEKYRLLECLNPGDPVTVIVGGEEVEAKFVKMSDKTFTISYNGKNMWRRWKDLVYQKERSN